MVLLLQFAHVNMIGASLLSHFLTTTSLVWPLQKVGSYNFGEQQQQRLRWLDLRGAIWLVASTGKLSTKAREVFSSSLLYLLQEYFI